MQIRPFRPEDEAQVIELIRLNTPEYFHASEEQELVEYLQNEREDYFVVEIEHKVVGAGGINYFPEEKAARISWDLIHPDYQGQGIGRALTRHRLAYLSGNSQVKEIVVRTSQLAYHFYQKMGFRLASTEENYWAPGYHLYLMRKENA